MRPGGAVLRDGPEQHPGELPVATTAHDEHVGPFRGLHQDGCGMAVRHRGLDPYVGVCARTHTPRPASRARCTSLSGSKSSGDRHGPAEARGPLPRHDRLEAAPGDCACRAAHSSAPDEDGEPSRPTTILPRSDCSGAIDCLLHGPGVDATSTIFVARRACHDRPALAAKLENGDRGGWPPFSKHRCLGRGGCQAQLWWSAPPAR